MKILFFLSLLLCITACRPVATPKPYAYYRIDIPSYTYIDTGLPQDYPYQFAISSLAYIDPQKQEGERYWVDVVYPTLNARIHCSYKAIDSGTTLRQLTDDAVRFVFDHAIKADAIPEQGFTNEEAHVFGVYYDLEGNTASPTQFFLTDSSAHFFRGALYYACIPNADSLEPVNEVIRKDIHTLVQSFRWVK